MYMISACSKTIYIKKPIYHSSTAPLIRNYDIKVGFKGDDVCISKEDYIKSLYMINDLKSYIEYQVKLIDEMNTYYTK